MENSSRINRLVLIIQTIFCFFMCFGYITRLGKTIDTRLGVPIIVSYLIVIGIEMIFYFRNRSSCSFSKLALACLIVSYAITLFTTNNDYIFFSIILLLLPFLLYFDKKLILIAAIFNSLINFGSAAIQLKNHAFPSGTHFDIYVVGTQVGLIIVFSFSYYAILNLILQMNQQKLDQLQKEHEKSEGFSKKMLEITNVVKENAESITGFMEELDTATDNSLSTLISIADGNTSNADSIGQQTLMTGQIQKMLLDAKNEAGIMAQVTSSSIEKVQTGLKDVLVLKEKSKHIEEFNKEILQTIHSFVTNAQEVKSMTEGIVNISSQTNLLALNASIESARAGEAGRGFSVVADEIRVLADQTKQLTSHISTIIQQLESNASAAQTTATDFVQEINEEHQLIQETESHYTQINTQMTELDQSVLRLQDRVEEIFISNNQIVDSITQLSASSEEVSASTQEAVNISEINREKTGHAKDLLDQLLLEAKKIEQYE